MPSFRHKVSILKGKLTHILLCVLTVICALESVTTKAMNFYISQCHAWAPGIETPEQWQLWSQGQLQPAEAGMPPAKAVPAMLRRRLTRWGRMALETACACAGEVRANTPVLFSSRHGDTQRTYALLQDLAQEEPLSPTAFSLSVHNASLGIYTIVQQALGASLALAAGKESLAHAMLEAATLLHEGADQVLLVHTDDDLAEFYQPYSDEADMPLSVALLLNGSQGRKVELQWQPAARSPEPESMSKEFLRWWFGDRNQPLNYSGSRLQWSWADKG